MEIQEIQDKRNNLLSGNLFGLVFDGNIPAAEVLLKVILKRDDLRIESVEGQKELRNPEGVWKSKQITMYLFYCIGIQKNFCPGGLLPSGQKLMHL